jgi:hypothetical protein
MGKAMSKDSFLERWSRRKLSGGRTHEPDTKPDQAADTPKAPEGAPDSDAADSDALADETLDEAELAQLPSLDTFTVKTDLAPFLRKGVPQGLRNAAMRKMWMLDPAIRDHLDFAVDYAWDWNTPGGVPGNAGTISRESLERMLDSLNPSPRDPATARSGPADETPDALENTAGTEPEAPAQNPQEPAAESVSDTPNASRADDRMSRPRRHGGAAPV